MYPVEQFAWEQPPTGASLSAAAAPYIPGVGLSGATVLELALALSPDSTPAPSLNQARDRRAEAAVAEEGGSMARVRWPASGNGGSGCGSYRSAECRDRTSETPRPRRRPEAGRQGGVTETPTKAARAAAQLRQLLDFYFEPFNLQHNRYLLDLIARRLGPPAKPGPWPEELLAEFRFSFDDLMGLGRIASALAKLKLSQSDSIGSLEHLHWTGDGRLQLRTPLEIRSFVAAKAASDEAAAAAAQHLAAVREQRGPAPADNITVLSYALGEALADQSPHSPARQSQLKRQLLLYHTDVVCLQGLGPEAGDAGPGLVATLAEEDYGCAWARGEGGETNYILWDRSRFEPSSRAEFGAALAMDLRALGDHKMVFRVVCMRPPVPTTSCTGLRRLFAGWPRGRPLIACVDLTLVGGAESANIIEEIAGMASLPREVLGDEIAAPRAAPSPLDGALEPVVAAASGLIRLHCPDGLLFEGLLPLLALSGHSEHHLATMAPEAIVQRFPAFRMPIVAAFRWPSAQAEAMEDIGDPAGPCQCIGLAG